MMHNHKKRNLLLIFLLGRLGFIFFDGIFNKEKVAENVVYYKNMGIEYQQHAAAPKEEEQHQEDMNLIEKKIEFQKKNLQDIKTLEYLYQQEKSPTILKQIIKKQAQNYNFNDARTNIEILKDQGESVDIHLFLYIYINSNNIKITEKESIKNLLPLLDSAVQKNLISDQDYIFYAWLIEIRNKNYAKALEKREQIEKPEYQSIIVSFQKAIKSYNPSKAIPWYYQDGLVALAALKNGYFTVARKIALETILEDENYILPYQILSYAHFLTNNRDVAIEYFLKLADFDKKNTETYQFLIGVAYYRKNDFTSSILYLAQNKSTKNQTDTLRYLIINYLEIDEYEKAIHSWQKLLGQDDIKNTDFFYYFYQVFYKGYFSQNTSIYESNQQLAGLFIEECTKKLGVDNDVCIYGRIGNELIKNDISQVSEVELITLSETYNQSYLYHILGDITKKQGKINDAKKWYAKALASSHDPKEKDFITQKLSTF